MEASYCGPKLNNVEDISPKWVEQMMEWQRDGKVLHKKYAVMIITKATQLFEKEDSLVRIEIDDLEEITVCGDVHG